MENEVSMEEWVQELPDSERRELMAKAKKRFWMFCLIGLIPYVSFVMMGFAIYCYNTYNYLKTRGRNTGRNEIRLLLLLWGMFLLPIIIVNVCSKNEKLGDKILGW